MAAGSNVVPISEFGPARARRGGDDAPPVAGFDYRPTRAPCAGVEAPPVVPRASDRRLPARAADSRARFATLLAGVLALHAAALAITSRRAPEPLPSVGLPAISVEIVLGARAPAGVAPIPNKDAAESELASATPERPRPPSAAQPEPALPEQAVSDEPILLIQPQRTDKEQPRPAFDPKRTPTDRAIADEKPTPRAAVPAPPLASDIGRGRSELDANYRGLVAAHLARHKRFPEEARRRRQTGHAVVTFSLDGRGNVTSVAVVRRSGVNSLDKEAEAMVRRAAPFPAPPNGAPVSFTVPVRFDLR